MNIWSTKQKGQFKLWAKMLAIFLSICLVTTLNPIGKNTQAWASNTTDEGTEQASEQANEDDQAADETYEVSEAYDSEDDSYSDQPDEDSSTKSSDESLDESYDSSISIDFDHLSTEDEESYQLSDEELSQLSEALNLDLTATDSENTSTDSSENVTTDTTISATANTDTSDIEKALNDSSTQYSKDLGDAASQIEAGNIVKAVYKYHFNEDKTGVIIDGIKTINDESEKSDDTNNDNQKKERTLVIPAKLNVDSYAYSNDTSDSSKTAIMNKLYASYSMLGSEDTTSEVKSYPVYAISDNAFEGSDAFTQVVFADSSSEDLAFYEYLTLGKDIFKGCADLKKVVCCRDVVLGESCFADSGLNQVIFNKNVENIGNEAFANCTNLTNIAWNSSSINEAFNFEKYPELGEGLYSCGSNIFEGCTNLKEVCLPNSIRTVSENALAGVDNLETAVLPFSVTKLESKIFGDKNFQSADNKLSKIVVLADAVDFDDSTFEGLAGSGTNSKCVIYANVGTSFLTKATEAKLPVTSDPTVLLNAINMYQQKTKKADDGYVQSDTRNHHAVSAGYGSGTESDPYVIRTVADLKCFSAAVNSGQTDACAVLANDIVMPCDKDGNPECDNNWISIGQNNTWTGKIDGNEYGIYGLSQNNTLTSNKWTLIDMASQLGIAVLSTIMFIVLDYFYHVGFGIMVLADFFVNVFSFFISWLTRNQDKLNTNNAAGFVHNAGGNYEIKNLDLVDAKFVSASRDLGGFVSVSNGNGKITNSTISGYIQPTDIMKQAHYGGFIGHVNGGSVKFEECENFSTVSASTDSERFAGGFVGQADGTVDFVSCTNSGNTVGNGVSTKEYLEDAAMFALTEVVSGLTCYGFRDTDVKWYQISKKKNDSILRNAKTIAELEKLGTDEHINIGYDGWKRASQENALEEVTRGEGDVGERVYNTFKFDENKNVIGVKNAEEMLDEAFTKPNIKFIKSEDGEDVFQKLKNLDDKFLVENRDNLERELEEISRKNVAKTTEYNKLLDEGDNQLYKAWDHAFDDSDWKVEKTYEIWDDDQGVERVYFDNDHLYSENLPTNVLEHGMYREKVGSSAFGAYSGDASVVCLYSTRDGFDHRYYFRLYKSEGLYEITNKVQIYNPKTSKWEPYNFSSSKMPKSEYAQEFENCLKIDNPDDWVEYSELLEKLHKNIEVRCFKQFESVVKSNWYDRFMIFLNGPVDDLIQNEVSALFRSLQHQRDLLATQLNAIASRLENRYVKSFVNSTYEQIAASLPAISRAKAWKWARVGLAVEKISYQRNGLRKLYKRVANAVNNNNSSNSIDTTTVSAGTSTNTGSSNYVEANHGYEQATGVTNVGSSSSALEKFTNSITNKEVEENSLITEVGTRSAVMINSDADYYYSEMLGVWQDINAKFGNSENLDFGTLCGAAGGFVGRADSKNAELTFDQCVNNGNVIAGETAGGFVGIAKGSNYNFNDCVADASTTVATVDSGRVLNSNRKPSSGGYVGFTQNSNVNMFGCTGGSTTLANSKSAEFVAGIGSGANVSVNASVSSGFSYVGRGDGYTSGFFGDVSNSASVSLSNSYCDGVVSGYTSHKGYLSASTSNNINYSNSYYYTNNDVYSSQKYATSFKAGQADEAETNGVECMTNTSKIQSGELCYKLNQGIGEGVFGQNFGVYPHKVTTKDSSGTEKTEIKWTTTERYERCLPFYAMRVYQYQDNNTTNAASRQYFAVSDASTSNTSDEAETTYATDSNQTGQVSTNTKDYYTNLPTECLQSGELCFIDVTADDDILVKPQGRMYIKNGDSYTFQMVGKNGHSVKSVYLDGVDVTKDLVYDETSATFKLQIKQIKANHQLVIKSKAYDYGEEPLIQDGILYIANISNLIWLYEHQNNTNHELDRVKQVWLVNDISLENYRTLTGKDWQGLGTNEKPFTYEFNGNGFTISNISTNALFKVTSNINIHDLILNNVSLSNSGVVDTALYNSTFTNVQVEGVDHCESAIVHNTGSDNTKGTIKFSGCFVEGTGFTSFGQNQPVGGFISTAGNNCVVEVYGCNINMKASYGQANSSCGGVVGKLNNGASFKMEQSEVNVDITQTAQGDPRAEVKQYTTIGGVIGNTNRGDYFHEYSVEHLIQISECSIGGKLFNNAPGACGIAFASTTSDSYVKNCFLNFSQIEAQAIPLSDRRQTTEYRSWSAVIGFNATFENNYAVQCGPMHHSAVGSRNFFQPYFTVVQTHDGSADTYYDETSKEFKEGWIAVVSDGSFDEAPNKKDNYQYSKDDLSSGKITDKLNNDGTNKGNWFVQKVDDEDLALPKYPTLNLKFHANKPDFVVFYDKNGGDWTGQTMCPQCFTKDSEQCLRQNIFTREGYTFVGWATSSSGKAVYKNMQAVKNLGKDGQRIKLYAVWSKNGSNDTQALFDSSYNADQVSYEESSALSSDASSIDTSQNKTGTVYKYKCEDVDEYYYSNLDDSNSYIVKYVYNSNEVNLSTPRESRVKFGKDTAVTTITPKDGYSLSSVDANVEYLTGTEANENASKTYPIVSSSETFAQVQIQKVYSPVVITINTKTVGEQMPSGSGTQADPYRVSNIQELIWIRNLVEGCAKDAQGKVVSNQAPYVKIIQNIDASNVDWKSIGSSKHPFMGNISGKGVDGLGKEYSVFIIGLHNKPLFGEVSGNAVISNIQFIKSETTGGIISHVADQNSDVKISNITIASGCTFANGTNPYRVGSLVDVVDGNTTIENCYSAADVTLEWFTGKSSLDDISCGGLVGSVYAKNFSIKNCSFTGTCDVKIFKAKGYATDFSYGGIVGVMLPKCDNSDYSIVGCINSGYLKNEGKDGEKFANAGGILGGYSCRRGTKTWDASTAKGDNNNLVDYCKLNIVSCENSGTIESESDASAGGFAGRLNFAWGAHTADVVFDHCLNTAQVVCNSNKKTEAGGFIGTALALDYMAESMSIRVDCCASCSNGIVGKLSGEAIGRSSYLKNVSYKNNYVLDLPNKNPIGKNNGKSITVTSTTKDKFESGEVVFNLNEQKSGDNTIGHFGQAINVLDYSGNQISSGHPSIILSSEDATNLAVYQVKHNTETYYSNYPEDKLVWVSTSSEDKENLSVSCANKFVPVNGKTQVSLSSSNGAYVGGFKVYRDGKEVETINCTTLSKDWTYDYKITNTGNYEFVGFAKNLEIKTPDMDAAGNYLLKDQASLIWAYEEVNVRHNTNIKLKLVADIDMQGVDFTPIGTESHKFTGTFTGLKDGTLGYSENDYYRISNLNTTKADVNGGLFGYVDGADISCVVLSNVTTNGSGAVYSSNGSYIKYVFVSGNVENSKNTDYAIASGIVAICENSIIKQCSSRANCSANVEDKVNIAGGIVGTLYGESNSVTGCINQGNLYSLGARNIKSYSGGIIGLIYDEFDPNIAYLDMAYIYGCTNRGYIQGKDSIGAGLIGGADFVGSKAVNKNTQYNWQITIKNCVNEALVGSADSELSVAAGLFGQIDGYNNNSVYSVVFESCSNCALVSANSLKGRAYTGGMLGVANRYHSVNFVNSSSYVTKINSEFSKNCSGLLVGREDEANKSITFNNVYYNPYGSLNACAVSNNASVEGSYNLVNNEEFSNGSVLAKLNSGAIKNSDNNYKVCSYVKTNPNMLSLLNNSSVYTLNIDEDNSKLTGNGSYKNPYLVTNAAQLLILSHAAYGFMGLDSKGTDLGLSVNTATIKICNDIDMSGVFIFFSFGSDPIVHHKFNGTLYADSSATIYGLQASLFQEIANESTYDAYTTSVKNITLDGGKCSGASFAHNASRVEFVNCKSINRAVSASGNDLGGLVDIASGDLSFKDCVNSCNLKANWACAGFVGITDGVHYLTFENCSNTGTVSGDFAAGYVAFNHSSCLFKNCTNSGAITAVYENRKNDANTAAGFVASTATGGLKVDVTTPLLTFQNCNNVAAINAAGMKNNSGRCAGFVGIVFNAANYKDPTVSFDYCQNSGAIGSVASNNYYSAGFAADIYTKANNGKAVFNNCISSGAVVGTSYAGGFCGGSNGFNLEFNNCSACEVSLQATNNKKHFAGIAAAWQLAKSTVKLTNFYYNKDETHGITSNGYKKANGSQDPIAISRVGFTAGYLTLLMNNNANTTAFHQVLDDFSGNVKTKEGGPSFISDKQVYYGYSDTSKYACSNFPCEQRTIKGTGTASDPYMVYSKKDLANLALEFNLGIISDDCHIRVVNDVDMSTYEDFIGFSQRDFKGVIDGKTEAANGSIHYAKISGLKCSLINKLEGGQVQNLIFEGTVNDSALVAREADQGKFTNLKVSGTKVTGTNKAAILVCETSNNTEISNCEIESGCSVSVNSTAVDAYAGAFVARANSTTTIKDCLSSANVVAVGAANTNWGYAGGIAGYLSDQCTLYDCVIKGNTSLKNVNEKTIKSNYYCGGVVGGINDTPQSCKGQTSLELCLNRGSVTASTGCAGGVVGFIGGYNNHGKNNVYIHQCINEGNIDGTTDTARPTYGGGILGCISDTNWTLTLDTCANRGEIIGRSDSDVCWVGGLIGFAKYDNNKDNSVLKVRNSYAKYNQIISYRGNQNNTHMGGIIGYCNFDVRDFDNNASYDYKNYFEYENYRVEFPVASNHQLLGGSKGVSGSDFKSGSVAYNLNTYGTKDKSASGANFEWLQTLDVHTTYAKTDEYPVMENAEKVYCRRGVYGELVYTNKDKNGTLQISNKDELVAFKQLVNSSSDEDSSQINAVLTADIDMSGVEWNDSIGTNDHVYNGTFDGQGHTISGLSTKSLFGYTSGAKISNFTVNANNCKGSAVVDVASNSTLENIKTTGTVTPKTSMHEGYDCTAGALVAYAVDGVTVNNCLNEANIVVDAAWAPAAGEPGVIDDVFAAKSLILGGVVGMAGNNFTMSECANTAQITCEYAGKYNVFAGGLIGDVQSENSTANISSSNSTGTISTNNNASGNAFAAALVGYVSEDTTCNIESSGALCSMVDGTYASAAVGCVDARANTTIKDCAVLAQGYDSTNTDSKLCSYIDGHVKFDHVHVSNANMDNYRLGKVADASVEGEDSIEDSLSVVNGQLTNVEEANCSENCATQTGDAIVDTKVLTTTIDFEALEYGKLTINGATSKNEQHQSVTVKQNSKVEVTIEPQAGYETDSLYVGETEIELDGKTTYELTVGTDPVNVYAVFKESKQIESSPTKDDANAYKLKGTNTVFTKWNSADGKTLPTTSGNYYLTGDINLESTWVIPAGANIKLSLDGNAITQHAVSADVIKLESGATLEIYDLRNNSIQRYYSTPMVSGSQSGAWQQIGTSKTMATRPANVDDNHTVIGGIITGAIGDNCSAIEVEKDATCILHQGNIVGNTGNTSAGGVNNYGTFENRHGAICGNFGKYVGGVVNHTSGTLTNFYKIVQNCGVEFTGGVRNIGVMNVGGIDQITGNTLVKNNSGLADWSIGTAVTDNDANDKVTQSCKINVVHKVLNPYGFTLHITDNNVAAAFGWVLTSGYANHRVSDSSSFSKVTCDNPKFSVVIENGEVALKQN